MAASLSEREVGDGGKGEVSSCVTNLIHAFTNGLDVFKRLRQRRRKRKARNQIPVEEISNDEMQLSNSLRRGPRDIENCYADHHRKAGVRFAKGDPIAHASLAETLIKLNTGLVNIIAAFLNHDRKSSNLNLDYRSLTNLSNASRAEAVDSLNQLYQRLSQSQVHLSHQGRVCPRCRRATISKHHDCSQNIGHDRGFRSDKNSRTNPRTRSNGPTVARIPIKCSSQTQLVVVRPRNPRKNSASSTRSHSAATTAASTAAPPSPVHASSRKDQARSSNLPTPIPQPAGRRRSSSVDGPRPTTWPQPKLETTVRLPAPPAKPPIVDREITPPSPLPIKRRADKVTPSTFTFASDSTKLGEIPEKNWIQPFDYAEADRLNAEALANWTAAAGGERVKPKKGLFSFLRRGTAVA